MVRIFQILARERKLQRLLYGLIVESALVDTPKPTDPDFLNGNDVPWVTRFAEAGGKVVISGDTQMKNKPHERLALVQAGMVTIFFESQWSNWPFFKKCALLLHWWPQIAMVAKTAQPGTFWHVPANWRDDSKLRQVSNDDAKLVRIQRQKANQAKVRARRAEAVEENQTTLNFELPAK
jgi:hypothetical protein